MYVEKIYIYSGIATVGKKTVGKSVEYIKSKIQKTHQEKKKKKKVRKK